MKDPKTPKQIARIPKCLLATWTGRLPVSATHRHQGPPEETLKLLAAKP
jgi:hypothetical protein